MCTLSASRQQLLYASLIISLVIPLGTPAPLGSSFGPAFRSWCLQAATCAPTVTCANTLRGGDWDICLDQVIPSQCLVYSIGIADDWRFDSALGELGCEVHAFDPTVELPEQLAPNVTFHQWGLQAGSISQKDMVQQYSTFKGPLFTLQAIIAKLGHADRRISILKIDCEVGSPGFPPLYCK